jgi:hypothetical protein
MSILLSLALPLTAQSLIHDWRYVPGSVELDLSSGTDMAWISNQYMINTEANFPGHWRGMTDIEAEALCPESKVNNNMVLVQDADFAIVQYQCSIDPAEAVKLTAAHRDTCEVFNRIFVEVKPPFTIVCGEPRGAKAKKYT